MWGRGASSLISSLAVAGDEKFYAEHADDAELIKNRARHFNGAAGNFGRHACRGDGKIQDMAGVLVFDGAVVHELAVVTARGDY